jgi:hypothetical protein
MRRSADPRTQKEAHRKEEPAEEKIFTWPQARQQRRKKRQETKSIYQLTKRFCEPFCDVARRCRAVADRKPLTSSMQTAEKSVIYFIEMMDLSEIHEN